MKKIVIVLVIVVVAVIALLVQERNQPLGALTKDTIPPELKLKVPKDKVLKAVDKERVVCDREAVCTSLGMMKVYDYVSDESPTDEFIFKNGMSFSQERVAERRPDGTTVVEFSAKKRAYKDATGKVYKVVHDATTTVEAYDLQVAAMTPIDKVRSFFGIDTALAGQDQYLLATSTVWVKPAGVTTIDLLVVAGGGGGPVIDLGGQRPGGGGAGGVTERVNYNVSASSSYNIVVGAGATVGTGNAGGDSSFDTIIALGGGAAGNGNAAGRNGGSGGGGSGGTSSGTGGSATQPGSASGGNGNNGGNSFNSGTNGNRAGGGGGGAGSAGSNAALDSAGAGGSGTTTTRYGTSVGVSGCFAGGGGGRSNSVDALGGCGGGQGRNDNGAQANGVDGTGGGGGGSQTPNGDGGDGAVIIKYSSASTDPDNTFLMIFSALWIHRFEFS